MYETMTRNNDITCRRWTDPGAEGEKNHRYKTFIPENVDERAGSSDSPLDGPENRKRKAKQPTDKGALYHEYRQNTILMSTNVSPIIVVCITGIRL